MDVLTSTGWPIKLLSTADFPALCTGHTQKRGHTPTRAGPDRLGNQRVQGGGSERR
jgi:hypothetical protein